MTTDRPASAQAGPSAVREAAYRWFALGTRRAAPLLLPLNTCGPRGYHRGRIQPRPVAHYCIYRRSNAGLVTALVRDLPAGSLVALHALDETAPELAAMTRAVGPGPRMALLDALIRRHPPLGRPVLITDDDISFVGTGACRFSGYAAAAAFDIAQPAHQPTSHATFFVTRVVPLSTARETRFVEIGPVVLFSPRVQPHVLPFPADAGMGWGLDVAWAGLREQGYRLGVIDATPIIHHGPVAAAYDQAEARAAQQQHLLRAGVSSAHELAGNVGRTWRPWQRQPRWAGPAATSAWGKEQP